MQLLQQSSTAQPLTFLLVDSVDHVTPVTGLSPTVTLSKSGGSFASPAGAVTEIGSGWYKVAGNATDTNTLGPLILHATGTGADPTDVRFSVVAYNPQDSVRLGLTALPNAAANASGGLYTLAGTGVDVAKWLGIAVDADQLQPRKRISAIAVAEAIEAVQTDRVAFVGLGDSNQGHSGDGWDHGFQYALSKKARMFATAMVSGFENGGAGSGLGYLYAYGFNDNTNGTVPVELQPFVMSLDVSVPFYGSVSQSSNADVLSITSTCPLGPSGALTVEFHYGTSTSGTHTFAPAVRLAVAPFTTLAEYLVNANTGTAGIARVDVTVAADAGRTQGIEAWTRLPSSVQPATVGLLHTYTRAVRTDRLAGFSFDTLAYIGGQPARSIVSALLSAPDAALTYRMSELRRLQGPTKRVVFILNEGLNDRADAQASLGPAAITSPSTSAAAFADNLLAIIERLVRIWNLNDWPMSELYWVLMVSHPISAPDDAQLIAYRTAAATLATYVPQCMVVDLSALTTATEMQANGWYAGDGNAHLSQAGYEALAVRAMDYIAGRSDLPSSVRDVSNATPASGSLGAAVNSAAQASVGTGDTSVNHDTGGDDALRVTTSGGAGIGSVTIRAYVKSEYDADALTASIRGEGTTEDDGRWSQPLMLDSDVEYELTFTRDGYTIPNTQVTP